MAGVELEDAAAECVDDESGEDEQDEADEEPDDDPDPAGTVASMDRRYPV